MGFEMKLHKSRILFQKDSCYKCQFCTKVRALSMLVSQACTNYIDKVPDVSGSNQNIETSCKNKSKSTELKNLRFKNTEKVAKER